LAKQVELRAELLDHILHVEFLIISAMLTHHGHDIELRIGYDQPSESNDIITLNVPLDWNDFDLDALLKRLRI
jgi:hypothetical protein